MKKKVAIIILLMALFGFPLLGLRNSTKKEENKNSISVEKKLAFLEKNLLTKNLPIERDPVEPQEDPQENPENEPEEDYVYHPMIMLPEIGDKASFAATDDVIEVLDQRWINYTDNVLMDENDVFEENKIYGYRMYYNILIDEERYIQVIGCEDNYPFILTGLEGRVDEIGMYAVEAILYFGDFNNLDDNVEIQAVEITRADPVVGEHPTYANNDEKYRIVNEKWINKTDNKVMTNEDVFEEGKKYDYELDFYTKYWVEDIEGINEPNDETHYVGGAINHINQPFTYLLAQSYYFGDREDLVIRTGEIVIRNTNPPVEGGTLVIPDIDFGNHVISDIAYAEWNRFSNNRLDPLDENYVLHDRDKVQFDLEIPLELGFEVINENVNKNFLYGGLLIDEEGGVLPHYHARYQIIKGDSTFGIYNDYDDILYPGQRIELRVFPENDDTREITWESSDETVATISPEGEVEVLKPGEVIITARNNKGETATCPLEIGTPVESLALEQSEVSLRVGENIALNVTITPEEASDKDFDVISDNNNIADGYQDRDQVRIHAHNPGTAYLTIKSRANEEAYQICKVIVTESPQPTRISFNKTELILLVDETETLQTFIDPPETMDRQLSWYSDNVAVATVNRNGKITAVSAGKANIYAETVNHIIASCHVIVSDTLIEATSISLDREEMEMVIGSREQLNVIFNPETTTSRKITWTTSNDKVATVEDGSVYAVKDGTAIITAKTSNGKEATCEVTVRKERMSIAYTTHVQTYGWQDYVRDGAMSGTQGEAKRLEGIKIKLENQDFEGDVLYRTHIQSFGWEKEFKKNDEMSGTSGQAKRLEAIEIKLDGEMAEHFDIYYRVHAQTFGWLGWARNGEQAGTAGYAKRLEGIEIQLVEKDREFGEYGEKVSFKEKGTAESITLNKTSIGIEAGEEVTLIATVLPEDAEDKTITWSSDNEDSATVDQNGKITTIHEGTATITARTKNGLTATCNVNILPPIPGVAYKTHVQTYGWQNYVSNGTMSGTSGEAKRLEAIQIKLKNQPFEGNIEYRTHIQTFGWEEGFKKNEY